MLPIPAASSATPAKCLSLPVEPLSQPPRQRGKVDSRTQQRLHALNFLRTPKTTLGPGIAEGVDRRHRRRLRREEDIRGLGLDTVDDVMARLVPACNYEADRSRLDRGQHQVRLIR